MSSPRRFVFLLRFIVLCVALSTSPASSSPTRAAVAPGSTVPSPALPPIPPLPAPTPATPHARLTLSQAVNTAMTHNPAIAAAQKNVEYYTALANQAFQNYYPQVNGSSSYNHAYSESTETLNGTSVDTTTGALVFNRVASTESSSRDTVTGQLSVSQILYDFDQRKFSVLAAKESVESYKRVLQQARNDTALTVHQQFFAAYYNQVLVRINLQSVADNREHLLQAEELYRAGTKARVDVTTAKANLATAQFALVKAQAALRTAWVSLNVAMGLPRDVMYDLDIENFDDVPAQLDRAQLLAIALAQRPELLNLLAQMRNALYLIQVNYRNRLPTFSASAQYGYTGLPSPMLPFWNAGVSASWRIFNGWLDHFQVAEYRASAENLALQLEQTRQQIFQQVATDCINFDQSKAEIESAVAGLDNAQENFRLVNERYKIGLGSSVDFIDAQTTLVQAEQNMATGRNDLRTARAQLEHDVGVYSINRLPPPAPPVLPDPIPGSRMKIPGLQPTKVDATSK